MTTYENAPATKMLATQCACCAKPLVDAVSVEIGIGPDCRKKHGYNAALEAASEDARQQANALIHKIALVQKGDEAFKACEALRALGFQTVADRVVARLAKIVIENDGKALVVDTPFNATFVARVKTIPGRKWDGEKGVNRLPLTFQARKALYAALVEAFPGKWARGPHGAFVIGSTA